MRAASPPLLLALLLAAPAVAVTPDAQAWVSGFLWMARIEGPEGAENGTLRVVLRPTGTAAAGAHDVLVVVTAQPLNGSAPPIAFERAATVTQSPPGETSGDPYHQVIIDIETTLPHGLWRLNASVRPASAPARVWDSETAQQRVGDLPRLGEGWGRVETTLDGAADLDGDGAADLRVEPAGPWAFQARDERWESLTRHGWSIWSRADGPAEGTFRWSGAFLRRALHVASLDDVQTGGCPGAVWAREGDELVARIADGPQPMCLQSSFADPFPADITEAGWYDGYRMHVNLSSWDLDGNGRPDLRFWDSAQSTPQEAKAAADEARRAAPVDLSVDGEVRDRNGTLVVEFAIERVDGDDGAAWIEVTDEATLIQLLDLPDAPLHYDVSLPENESFVAANGTGAWVWFGHFSTQHLVIGPSAAPARSDLATPPTPTHMDLPPTREPTARGVPFVPVAFVVALAALALLRRR